MKRMFLRLLLNSVGLQNGIFAIVKNAFSNCKMLMFLAMSVMGSQPFVT